MTVKVSILCDVCGKVVESPSSDDRYLVSIRRGMREFGPYDVHRECIGTLNVLGDNALKQETPPIPVE